MDSQKLKVLLHLQSDEILEPTPFCPSGSELASRLNGQEAAADQESLERHLADCSYCRAQAAVLARFLLTEADTPIPRAVFARADQLGNRPRHRQSPPALRWAAAAAAFMALAAIFTQSQYSGSDSVGDWRSNSDPESREVRTLDFAYPGPTVLSPADGSSIRPGELTVRWTEVPGSIYYDVRLVDAKGFVLWQDRVKADSARPPSQLRLESGERYFVRVDAYLAEAKRISSSHVNFIYEGQD